MARLMRCQYCGILQDEPVGAKVCDHCGGELAFEAPPPPDERGSYIAVQMELDQVMAPAGQNAERHLLITLRTPEQVPPAQAARTEAGRPPLGCAVVLDVSGSMEGEKLAQAKDAVRQALARLQDGDRLSLVTFSSDVRCVMEPTAVTAQARRVVESALGEIRADGMTALCGGLELGIAKAGAMEEETRLVLLLSDGQANVGETDVARVGDRALGARQQGIIISTLGVGSDYNEALMVEIATQGGGRFYHLQRADQIGAYLTGELGEVASPAARDAEIHLHLPAGALLMPLSTAYPAQQGGGQATIQLGTIPCSTELEIPVRVTLPGQAAGARASFEGSLTYASPAGHRLRSSLNRVTVRFVAAGEFHHRDGAVVPVVERVLEHMEAVQVLGVSRAMAMGAAASSPQQEAQWAQLREYASLLGEERGALRAQSLAEASLGFAAAAPQMAKEQVSRAYGRMRSTKKFDKKNQSA